MKGLNTMKLLTGILSLMLIIGTAPVMVFAVDTNVPMTVSYQCDLAGADGTDVTLTFIFYNSSDAAQFTKTQEEILITNGIVSTEVPIEEEYLDTISKMGVKVNNGDVMEPKVNLTSSIFAMKAKYAERLIDDGGPGSIDGSALVDGAITAAKIADGSISEEKLSIGAISSEKLSVKSQTITSTAAEDILTEDDQGLILVEGDTTINLPIPDANNKGFKYSIKKIDDGARIKDCEVKSDVVTIQCGTGSQYNSITSTDNYIENRTYKIELIHKNEFVTLVSNGDFWYVLESNPPQDIVNPTPGKVFGIIEKGIPATLTWTNASDCASSNCYDSACKNLEYMAYIAQGTDGLFKLRTLEAVRNVGIPCQESWTSSNVMICDPGDDYEGYYKANLVVRDSSGNLSIFEPPGDNNPPEVKNIEVGQVSNYIEANSAAGIPLRHYIGLTWKVPEPENVTFTYSVFYIKDTDGGQECLEDMDDEDGFEPPEYCRNIVTAIDSQPPNGVYDYGTFSDHLGEIKMTSSVGTELRVDISDGLVGNTDYWLTIIVQDPAGNKTQYQVVPEKTRNVN